MGAEIPDGAVLVARAILNSSLWNMRPPDRVVAITCIVLANRRPKKWFDGETNLIIERGQFVRSREKMVEECNLPLQVVRTSIEHLERSDFLTRKPTRTYTLYTIPKYDHYQDLTKYSDNLSTACGENQPDIQPDPNHKQQQQTHPPVPSEPVDAVDDGRKGTGRKGGGVVVVDPERWPDPVLAKPSFRLSMKLLESVQMSERIASSLAASKPVGQVLRVTQQARLQKNPGGWAKTALQSDWKLPEATGDELREVITIMKADVERANAAMSRGLAPRTKLVEPRPGESADDLLRRANAELLKRRKGPDPAGGKKRKG